MEDVARLVRLTATHEVAADDRDGAVLCDADLAVLAATAARYESYVEGVRREYAHLDDGTFARGRAAVLRSLLDRPVLFRTTVGPAGVGGRGARERGSGAGPADGRSVTGRAGPRRELPRGSSPRSR